MNILRKIKLNLTWNRGGFVSLLAFLVLIHVLFMMYLGGQDSLQARSVHVSPVRLDIKNAPSTKPIFKVYYPISNDGLARSLGKELVIKLEGTDEYSAVEITYYLGVSDKTMKLQKGMFNLFLSKPEFEKSLPEKIGGDRMPLASHIGYEVFLISKNDSPRLDGSYLSEKSLGLIADHFSESGYIYPKKVILDSIKKENLPSFKSVYATHRDLRKGLLNGEVDLIASYWDAVQRRDYPEWKFLKVADVPKGHTWYLDQAAYNLEVTCAVTEGLKINAKKQPNDYWSNLIDLSGCSEVHE